MISQKKIELAVLLKLFHHSEQGGEAETPREIAHLFAAEVSTRRVEVALEELERRGEVVREYHPHYSDEGLWQISRAGFQTVEKALRLPSSFIARLSANGDGWLATDEAKQAVLNKLARYNEDAGSPLIDDTKPADTRTVAAGLLQQTTTPSASTDIGINWTKWGTIIGGVGILVTIIIAVI